MQELPLPSIEQLTGIAAIFGPIVWGMIEMAKKAGLTPSPLVVFLTLATSLGVRSLWWLSVADSYTLRDFAGVAFESIFIAVAAAGLYQGLQRVKPPN